MTTPVKTYLGLYAHAARLTVKGVGRRLSYLLVAPVLVLAVNLITPLFAPMGIAGGFLYAIVRAVAVSAGLFVVRAIIEQRKLGGEDITRGLTAFLGDVMTVFFTLWIGGMLLGQMLGQAAVLVYVFVLFGLPVFETVALSHVGGFMVFSEAWRFFRRDAAAWLIGQLPLIVVAALSMALSAGLSLLLQMMLGLPLPLLRLVAMLFSALPWALIMIAFVYRGVLFLTLEGTSPHARAARFGGAATYR